MHVWFGLLDIVGGILSWKNSRGKEQSFFVDNLLYLFFSYLDVVGSTQIWLT